jgi:putative transposase
LVKRAEDWRWSSLWHRVKNPSTPLLHAWPMPLPEGWLDNVNGVETSAELAALRRSVQRGLPLGHEVWQRQTAEQRGLCLDAKPRGRPRKVVVTP